MTPQLGHAIRLLKLSNRELRALLAIYEAINPYLGIQAQRHRPEERHDGAGRLPSEAVRTSPPSAEAQAAPAASLDQHARREIRLVLRDPREIEVAEHFVEALEPTGWLGAPLEEISANAGCSIAEAAEVLTKIQRIDPPGLFARSLAECLRLQAEDAGTLTPLLDRLLGNLPMLALGDIDGLARLCGCTRKEVVGQIDLIRGFNPKPGLTIDDEPPVEAPPDLIVSETEKGWQVELNRSTLPDVEVVAGTGLSAADRQMLDAARTFARAYDRRNLTTLKVGAEIVKRQSAFLREGPGALTPMSYRDIAGVLDIHPSTVSRVAAGLQVATPRGVVALRDFFSVGLGRKDGGQAVSAAAVSGAIADMIAAEDKRRPLSDAAIADELGRQGIRVARRTIAKYREAQRIPASADRRRRVSLSKNAPHE